MVVKRLVVAVSGLAVVFGCGAKTVDRDLVVYGATSAGLSAAVQAARMGISCVVVSPDRRIGGLTTGGLGQTDIGNKNAFGGIALEFYRDVATYYRLDANWRWQKRRDYFPDGQCAGTQAADSMWTFEPSAALKILEGWVRRDRIEIVRGARLNRSAGKVRTAGRGEQRRIVSFETEDGTVYVGRMFVDATYEGDLMAAAGVSYFVGREANSVYGESISGVQRKQAKHHQFYDGVDPYVVKGDPTSGLLPGVLPYEDVPDGTGDKRVQAYCFRMCLTDVPDNRIPFAKPAEYDEREYELLFRNYEQGDRANPSFPWINSRMPNGKTDTNNSMGFSTDFIGRNWSYPEASYEEREKIIEAHLTYQRGLMWTLANHPRVPERIRRECARWGTCRDEFEDGFGDGWQRQLYVREARRMVGEYVMTQSNCSGRVVAPRPVALGSYGMDSHHSSRAVTVRGDVKNEGDIQDWSAKGRPYPIDYGALLPKRSECGNLLVPVCVSASHMAFGSMRMEPVFFALGQVVATAAAQAIAAGVSVQDVNYALLRQRLLSDGMVLEGFRNTPSHLLPAGAAVNGFTRCVVNERPNVDEIAPDATGRSKWYNGQWYFGTRPDMKKYSMTNGVLAIEWGGDIVSAPKSFREIPKLPYLPGKDGFYVEFETSLSDNDPDHFPAVWMMPIEKNMWKDDRYPGYPDGVEHWMELDVDEGGFGEGLCGTVHNWWGRYPDYHHIQNGNNVFGPKIDRTKRHTFGAAYDPQTRTVSWYVDNRLMMSASAPYVPNVASQQHFYFIISAQCREKVKPYTMYVYAVRAFVPETSVLPSVPFKP